MDAFTKRFYEKGNETNSKEGGNKKAYPTGGKKNMARKMSTKSLRNYHRESINRLKDVKGKDAVKVAKKEMTPYEKRIAREHERANNSISY